MYNIFCKWHTQIPNTNGSLFTFTINKNLLKFSKLWGQWKKIEANIKNKIKNNIWYWMMIRPEFFILMDWDDCFTYLLSLHWLGWDRKEVQWKQSNRWLSWGLRTRDRTFRLLEEMAPHCSGIYGTRNKMRTWSHLNLQIILVMLNR